MFISAAAAGQLTSNNQYKEVSLSDQSTCTNMNNHVQIYIYSVYTMYIYVQSFTKHVQPCTIVQPIYKFVQICTIYVNKGTTLYNVCTTMYNVCTVYAQICTTMYYMYVDVQRTDNLYNICTNMYRVCAKMYKYILMYNYILINSNRYVFYLHCNNIDP